MTQKPHVGILMGGQSPEHEISILSARNVIDAIDKEKYDVTLIGITQQGQWQLICDHALSAATISPNGQTLAFIPGCEQNMPQFLELTQPQKYLRKFDVIFPVLHGIYGEDGSIQGLLKLANIPFVGAGVTGSAISMDKDVMKRLLRNAEIKVPNFRVCHSHDAKQLKFKTIGEEFGLPLFIKPANAGSSIGVNKVCSAVEFKTALDQAFSYDHKVIIEEFIPGREIECAVLGADEPIASTVGEIISHHPFYSYAAKYLDKKGATLEIPADIPQEMIQTFKQLAIKTFKTLCCQGMARVDFFLRSDNTIIVNELNTIPGFTSISMYPKLWQASGLSYTQLIDKLIELTLSHFEKTKNLSTRYL
jgi:D-alanine-D-alanine ligase